MLWLIVGLVLFLGIHSIRIAAPALRQAQIDQRGLNAWKGIYSVISLIGFVILVWGYGIARQDPVIFWVAPAWMSQARQASLPSLAATKHGDHPSSSARST